MHRGWRDGACPWAQHRTAAPAPLRQPPATPSAPRLKAGPGAATAPLPSRRLPGLTASASPLLPARAPWQRPPQGRLEPRRGLRPPPAHLGGCPGLPLPYPRGLPAGSPGTQHALGSSSGAPALPALRAPDTRHGQKAAPSVPKIFGRNEGEAAKPCLAGRLSHWLLETERLPLKTKKQQQKTPHTTKYIIKPPPRHIPHLFVAF